MIYIPKILFPESRDDTAVILLKFKWIKYYEVRKSSALDF